jgi:photosystem II stability/assembly factor-like uncharacterized protein
MKGRILGGVLAGALSVGMALADVQPVYSGKPHDVLFAVQTTDEGLVAVGGSGQYSRSRDGKTWEHQQIADDALSLLSVSEVKGNALAVGQGGAILRRGKDGWKAVTTPTKERLLSVAQGEDGVAMAVGGFGTVLRSRDGGQSWEALKLDWESLIQQPYQPHVYTTMFDTQGNAFIAGEFGMIARSRDGGDNWELMHSGEESVFGLAMNRSGYGMAVGQSGLVLRTRDFGERWEALDAGTGAILLEVAVREDGAAVAAGIREAIRFPAESATPVRLAVAPFLESWFTDIAILNGEFYLVGQQAQVVKVDL